MKCKEFKDNMENLSGGDITQEMARHMSECAQCEEYYSVIESLTPRVTVKAPGSIKRNVMARMEQADAPRRGISTRGWFARVAAAVAVLVAAAAVATTVGRPNQAVAAQRILDSSLAAASNVTEMEMKIDVRTRPNENFAVIDLSENMVGNTLTVQLGNPSKWRLEKSNRVVVFDGKTKYMWDSGAKAGSTGDRYTGFEEWFNILLDPEMILIQEKLTAGSGDVRYKVKEKGKEIIMTADTYARGDFSQSTYLRNTSVEESDTRREIVFDKDTKLIKSMKIYVKDNAEEILVVDIREIKYNTPVDQGELLALPAGMTWRPADKSTPSSGKFIGISAKTAAELIVIAINRNNLDPVIDAFYEYDQEEMSDLSDDLKGAKVTILGEPFKSGMYPGVFVPYEVKLSDGRSYKQNLALRNDNGRREWRVDGGI